MGDKGKKENLTRNNLRHEKVQGFLKIIVLIKQQKVFLAKRK